MVWSVPTLTHTHTHTDTYIYTYIYVCVCVGVGLWVERPLPVQTGVADKWETVQMEGRLLNGKVYG